MSNLSFQLAFGIIGMILLATFIIVFFVIYQRRLLQQQLNAQQAEAAYQKDLLNAGVLAQEAERERIATDLHDSIGGLLSATKIYVSNITQQLSTPQFELFKKKALQTLNENIGEIRTITNDLFPQSLEHVGVVAASRKLVEKLTELKQIQVDFYANKEQHFNKNREKVIFRILQELTNNTFKHSEAEKVPLHFHFESDQLIIHYSDDGRGFDRKAYDEKKDFTSFGLKSIDSRIAFLNGKITYETAPKQGVEVKMEIPLINPSIETNTNGKPY
ncbi:MAG: ATP-binding protein [Bacteroidota bacterium]